MVQMNRNVAFFTCILFSFSNPLAHFFLPFDNRLLASLKATLLARPTSSLLNPRHTSLDHLEITLLMPATELSALLPLLALLLLALLLEDSYWSKTLLLSWRITPQNT
jgi:hypothetical protein